VHILRPARRRDRPRPRRRRTLLDERTGQVRPRRQKDRRATPHSRNLAKLQRDTRRAPYLAATAILGVPAYAIWGPWFGVLIFTGTLFLPIAAWYIMRGHIEEYGVEHGYVSEELAELNSGSTVGEPTRDEPDKPTAA
jgi:hypothetical protein